MARKIFIKNLLSILVCLLAAFVGYVAAQTSYHDWYLKLEKSTLHGPEIIYPIGWLLLYIIMGIAAGLVWSKGFYHKWVQVAVYHFGFQLVLSSFWFILFFGIQRPLFALIDLGVLFILLIITFRWFRIVNPTAAYLLIPHMVWLVYIGFLNFEIWRLN